MKKSLATAVVYLNLRNGLVQMTRLSMKKSLATAVVYLNLRNGLVQMTRLSMKWRRTTVLCTCLWIIRRPQLVCVTNRYTGSNIRNQAFDIIANKKRKHSQELWQHQCISYADCKSCCIFLASRVLSIDLVK